MLPKIECSDERLLGILNHDSGCATEFGLQHLDECEHCQVRIEELAANKQQWSLAREGLCSRVEGGLDFEKDFESPTRFTPAAEHSSDWTDTMAKQLLQPPSHPEMLGRLGRYEIERLVGSGGMGVVFKAYDSELHRSVAIKMLAPHLSGSRSARERFAREARAAAAIVNDHVVPIHNVETEHATPYLVMQYVAGDSLQARLDRDGPLDVCEILRIGMQVATGLAAAHAQGLIHRDVKPSNIMLDENVARALLTDFGLARTQDDAAVTRSGFHPGTPHYMSPEQVRGEELDGRSDLFSLGCVLYALCTGHPPHRADSGYAVMRRITDDQPRSIREQNALIPEWLERVVMRLLEKDRESRFQSAEELAQILEQCLAHVQKPTTEPLPLAVLPKTSFFDRGRIRNWILAGMASAFLFFAGVFIVLETYKGTITIKSEADNVPIRIKRSDKVVEDMVVSRAGKSVRLAAGDYVIEFDGDSQDLVVESGNVSLVRGETKTLQITYRKSDGAEARISADKQERTIDKTEINAPEQMSNLASAIDEFNRGHSAELIAANSPLLTEDELYAALWWQADHTKISSELRKQLRAIVLDRKLPHGWSIRLKKVQWDMDKRWHGAPATSNSIEIHLMQSDQVVSTIRRQFVSSGLASTKRSTSPLADAIEKFNKDHSGDQPRLTFNETLAALSTIWLKAPEQRSEAFSLTEGAVSRLMQVADTHMMDGVTIQPTLRTHEVGDSNFLTWSIDLAVMPKGGIGWAETFQIRKRFIKVDWTRISARKSQEAAPHNLKEPAKESDLSKPKASISRVASDLASTVHDFNNDLQSTLDSVKLKFNQGLATQDQVIRAEMEMLEAKIRTAETENTASLPALLKEREGILQRAFLVAKTKYDAGLIGIDPFSEVVAELVDAEFATRIDGRAVLLDEKTGTAEKANRDAEPSIGKKTERMLKREIELAKVNAEIAQVKLEQAEKELVASTLRPLRRLPFPKELQGIWRINEAFSGTGKANEHTVLAQYANQIVPISGSTMFLQSNIEGNHWYLSHFDPSTSPMEVDLSVRLAPHSDYQTFACRLEIKGDKLYLVRAQSPEFPRPQSAQELTRGETCFAMTRMGEAPMTPEEMVQVAKASRFHKDYQLVRFKVASVHAPFVLGEPSDGHREGELHLDCRPDPHDFSLDQFLVVLTAECQKKLRSEGVDDITKHFLGKTITATGPVRGVEYTARAMRGEHFYLIINDPSKLIIDKSE